MKIKDFFRLAIKLYGLYALILAVFTLFPQIFGYMAGVFSGGIDTFSIVWAVSVGGALLSFYLFLLFQPDWTINKLKLDEKFDVDEINFGNVSVRTLLSIGIIFIGGLTVIDNLAPFVTNSFYFVKSIVATSDDMRMESALNDYDHKRFVMNLINIIVGYVLLTNYAFVSSLLISKREEDESS